VGAQEGFQQRQGFIPPPRLKQLERLRKVAGQGDDARISGAPEHLGNPDLLRLPGKQEISNRP
jgi:hypothetical protein